MRSFARALLTASVVGLAACASHETTPALPGGGLQSAAAAAAVPEKAAKGLTVLYAFGGSPDGSNPQGGLLLDAAGDIFGTTYEGGAASGSGVGTVFELKPAGKSYAESLVYTFDGANGAFSSAAPIDDTKGDLFVTTSQGGQDGNGTATELSPSGNTYAVAAFFTFPSNGCGNPQAPLVRHNAALYTTETGCGKDGKGLVEALNVAGLGGSDIYDFQGAPSDGDEPVAPLFFHKGALYGTTYLGGSGTACSSGCGTVFELVPGKKGATEKVLWNFQGGNASGSDGAYPAGGVILDASGNIYGTTREGGSQGAGTVFELSPAKGGGYTEAILHTFTGTIHGGPDGGAPLAGLTAKGTLLYGTTSIGGSAGEGTIFQIGPHGTNYKVLHSFSGGDGNTPFYGSLVVKGSALYGTTEFGGNAAPACSEGTCGVVYRFVP